MSFNFGKPPYSASPSDFSQVKKFGEQIQNDYQILQFKQDELQLNQERKEEIESQMQLYSKNCDSLSYKKNQFQLYLENTQTLLSENPNYHLTPFYVGPAESLANMMGMNPVWNEDEEAWTFPVSLKEMLPMAVKAYQSMDKSFTNVTTKYQSLRETYNQTLSEIDRLNQEYQTVSDKLDKVNKIMQNADKQEKAKKKRQERFQELQKEKKQILEKFRDDEDWERLVKTYQPKQSSPEFVFDSLFS